MTRPLRVLHLEDHPSDAALIRDRLETEGVLCDIRLTDGKDSFEAALAQETFDLIISDYNLPGYDGIAALKHAQVTQPDVPVILVSGTVSEEEAVKCLRLGATDYLLKERLDRLAPAVRRAIEEARTRLTRKRAEVALAQSEKRKAAILDSVLDSIITMDASGVVIEFNSAAERTFGYTKAQAIGRPLTDLIIPVTSHQAHTDGLARSLATGVGPILGKLIEMTARRADGSELPVELTITAVHTEQAPIFTGVLRDITARKRADETQGRLAAIVESSDDAIFSVSLDDTILTWNAGAERLYGYTADEIIGRNKARLVPADREDEERQTLQAITRGERPKHFETRRQTRDGSLIDVSITVSPIRDAAGTVIGVSKVSRDITERKRAEEIVRRASGPAGVRRRAGTAGFDLAILVVASFVMYMLAARLNWFESVTRWVLAHDVRQLDETIFAILVFGVGLSVFAFRRWREAESLLTSRQQAQAALALLHDELDRRVRQRTEELANANQSLRGLEQQSQQTQKMEAIGQLAGGVAHDFNNLLTVILGYCEMMLEDIGTPEACHGGLVQIQKAGQSAAGLTRQLLAFSRKEIISPTLLDLNVVLANMRVMLRRLIREDVKVELTTRTEPALVMADRGQIEQIVLNLSVNARDAMPKGGTLKIDVATVVLDDRYAKTHVSVRPGPYVSLTVTDTGEGIPPEVQTRLFEPFFTTKEPGRGTGLGLATVHGIVTQNGGSIEVSSAVGVGTTFRLYFPQAQPAVVAVEVPVPVVRTSSGSETIVVVEDEEGLRLLITSLLERLGYTVLTAENAARAIELFDEHPSIDLLLTDVVMPGGSGPDLSTWLAKGRPHLKVLYMSGYTDDAIVHHGVLNPGIAFLHKPFTAQALGLKIRDVLDQISGGATHA